MLLDRVLVSITTMLNGWSLFVAATTSVVGVQIYNALVSPSTSLAEKKKPFSRTSSNRSFVSLADLTKRKSDDNLLKQSSSLVSFGLYQIDEEEDFTMNIEGHYNTEIIPRTNSYQQLTGSKLSRLTRNESEMSLGLNRTNSFVNHVMELGEFCPSGQVFIGIARYTFIATAATAILYYQLTSEPLTAEEIVSRKS